MGAPKGNVFAIGNTGGRPPHYETPELLWEKASEYFETTKTTTGKYKPSIDMLTFYMGFSSRSSWVDYAKRSNEFSHMCGLIKMFVRGCYEQNLSGFAWAGSQFALRNIGKEDWQDEVIQQQNQTVQTVTITEKVREAK